jgi:hypothetical protein
VQTEHILARDEAAPDMVGSMLMSWYPTCGMWLAAFAHRACSGGENSVFDRAKQHRTGGNKKMHQKQGPDHRTHNGAAHRSNPTVHDMIWDDTIQAGDLRIPVYFTFSSRFWGMASPRLRLLSP